MHINSQTTLNMVIGYPLSHTQSPLLHTHLYQHLKLNAVLLAFSNQHIESLLTTIKTLNVTLTAVTLPFKESVLPYLQHCSPEGQAIKAVNTIIQRDGELHGYNTDVDGIAYAFNQVTLTNKRVLIIGAGGAARASGYLMQKENAQLFWLNRTQQRAEKLAADFSGTVVGQQATDDLDYDIIINTTPLGMSPNIHQSPLPNVRFRTDQVVFDMVYNPLKTQLLVQAEQNGAHIISGMDMFIGQAIRQIELWQQAPIDKTVLMNEIKHLLLKQQSLGV